MVALLEMMYCFDFFYLPFFTDLSLFRSQKDFQKEGMKVKKVEGTPVHLTAQLAIHESECKVVRIGGNIKQTQKTFSLFVFFCPEKSYRKIS